ncbi:Conserved_hypothetical protein [Hexamita inflata]|uniref:Uncharacterized protein n=1 Tax=Hexamita inflata TaxID=28002 RepID=A0ABP1GFP5_9EUKA
MEIFDNNTPLNNRLHKLYDKEVNDIASLNFDNNIFSALFLDVCLYKQVSQSVLAIKSVEKIFQFVSLQNLQQRKEEITNKYGALSLETIKLDIEQEIQQRDQLIINQLNQIQQKESNILKNKFVVEHMDLYSLKFFDHLKHVNENATLIVRKCINVTFEEVPIIIRNLFFDDTYLSTLEGIQKMKQLRNLQINTYACKDFQYLQLLENLTTLSLNNNYYTKNTELNICKLNNLVTLDLSANKIESCQFFVFPDSLKILNLSCNNISTLDRLHLVNLVELDLRNNKLQDIQQIGKIHSLVKLNLSNNLISDISPLYGNECLVELNISKNKITLLNQYQQAKHGKTIMKSLEVLILKYNQIKDISDVRQMIRLIHLDISRNINVIEEDSFSFDELTDFDQLKPDTIEPIVEPEILDLMPLQHLHRIKYLNLEGNLINNIWPLKRLVNLEELNVNNNLIVDINVVQYLVRLRRLNINRNIISDVSILFILNMTEIELQFNYISQESIDQLIEQNIKVKLLIQKYFFDDKVHRQLQYNAKRITRIFRTNDKNQNTNEQMNRTKTQLKLLKRNISEIIQRSVINQVHFTGRVVELFQTLLQ